MVEEFLEAGALGTGGLHASLRLRAAGVGLTLLCGFAIGTLDDFDVNAWHVVVDSD